MDIANLSAEDGAKLLSKMSTIARQAAVTMRRPVTEISSDNNPTTNVDSDVSTYLRTALTKLYDAPVLSEEDDFRVATSMSAQWVIDPVDGTLNLLSDSPDVAISLALMDSGVAQLAVVFLPFHDQLFYAQRNRGSYLGGKRLRSVSRTKIAAYGLPGRAQEEYLDLIEPIQCCVAAGYFLRQSGSAAVDICRVARGTWSAFFQRRLFIWDVAAADLIAREAGGTSTMNMHRDGVTCDYLVTGIENNIDGFRRTIHWE